MKRKKIDHKYSKGKVDQVGQQEGVKLLNYSPCVGIKRIKQKN